MLLVAVLSFFLSAPPQSVPGIDTEVVSMHMRPDGHIDVQVEYRLVDIPTGTQGLSFPETEWFKLRNFVAQAGGERAYGRRELAPDGRLFEIAGDHYPAIWRFELDFKSSHDLKLNYSYRPPIVSGGTKSDGPEGRYVEYVLRSGAAWRGRVSYLHVTFDTGSVNCRDILVLKKSIQGSCVSANQWYYFEPYVQLDRNVAMVLPP